MQTSQRQLSALARIWLVLLGLLILAGGAFFAINGYTLATLGGSAYFVVCGLVLAASGIQIVRQRPSGAVLYALAVAGTVIWSLAEVGLDFWPLVSRALLLAGVAVLVALSFPLLRRAQKQPVSRTRANAVAGVLALACLATVGGMFVPHAPVPAVGDSVALKPVAPDQEQRNWAHYGNCLLYTSPSPRD